eukprot:COSAG01_NODE_2468_length_7634_cov_6.744127_3_plen_48_part_00
MLAPILVTHQHFQTSGFDIKLVVIVFLNGGWELVDYARSSIMSSIYL